MSATHISIRSVAGTLILAGILVTLGTSSAEAIPPFARKYGTSCQTCHIAYPKLNTFGQAFRFLGYRMPAETEDMVKEVPVSLGAPGYKRMWPDAVWPSDMPGTVPLGVDITLTSLSQRKTEEGGETETIKNDLRFPEEVGILGGGTLGETLSFFAEVAFEQEVEEGNTELAVELEHAQFNFNGPFGWGSAFNLKVGRFTPELTQPFGHNELLTTGGPAVFTAFNPIAPQGGAELADEHAAGTALPHSVDGLEAYGILEHRFLYSGGISNGIGPGRESVDGNNAKDVFGRVAYKFGGLALDGDGYVSSAKNWRERSFEIGFFAYRGDGAGVFFAAEAHGEEEAHSEEEAAEETSQLLEDRTFTRFGLDANLFIRDLNVIAGYTRGSDNLVAYEVEHDELVLHEDGDFTYSAWFLEGDYVFLPWLHGALRYEWLRPAREDAPDIKRIVPNVTALIRANVKAYVEYQRDLGETDDYLLLASLRFAF